MAEPLARDAAQEQVQRLETPVQDSGVVRGHRSTVIKYFPPDEEHFLTE